MDALLGLLPYLLILLCPVLMLFMHGGRGHGHAPDARVRSSADLTRATPKDGPES